MYSIKPNRTYRIVEKINAATPEGLKAIGRVKMGSGFSEFIGCLYDTTNNINRYDTGLDKTSREFFGKKKEEVEKILADREDLIEYFEMIKNGRSNEEFLPSFTLQISHNTLLDTSNPDTYLKLFLAMRGNLICPETEIGNPKHNASNYILVDSDEQKDVRTKVKEMEIDIQEWLFKTWSDNKEEVLEYLRYSEILALDTKVNSKVGIVQAVEMAIKNYDNLLKLHTTIKTKTFNDVKRFNLVRTMIRKGQIKRVGQLYTYEGIELGTDAHSVTAFLFAKANKQVAAKLLEKFEDD
jgi:hypothetical protein